MAAGTLSKPGTKLGPCAGSCKHGDCAETRRMAAHSCRVCGEAIGYGVDFLLSGNDIHTIAHASCVEAAAAISAAKRRIEAVK